MRNGLRSLWLCIGGAIIAFGLPYMLPGELADRVRWSGMLFQFLGLATVVWGLNNSRKLFGRPSLGKALVQNIVRRVKPPKPVSVTGIIRSEAAASTGYVTVETTAPIASIGDRVARLEGAVKNLKLRHDETKLDLRNVGMKMGAEIKAECDERQSGDAKVTRQIEEATIGGIHLEIVGLFYLYVGILFTSVPVETACLLQKIGL